MFKIGDYVMKTNTGVCQVDNITHVEDRDTLYYLLIPIADKKMKIYIPVDGNANSLRYIISEEKAWELIYKIPHIKEVAISNERLREQEYKNAIHSGKPEMLVRIIKTMYYRKQERENHGKKVTAMDSRYFQMAEQYLYSELAVALKRKPEDMCQLIEDTIHKTK